MLGGQVRLELPRGHDLHGKQHATVIQAAQLAAVADEGARLGGGDLEVVRVIGDDVPLEQELGDPERVHDIGGGQVELDRLAGRDLQHWQRTPLPHVADVGDV